MSRRIAVREAVEQVRAPARAGRRRSWRELSPRQRAGGAVLGAVEVVLTTAAARDLARRRPEQVRGPRWAWGLVLLVQPVGPPAYLLLGPRRDGDQRDDRG
jgi:hypothetical protein